MHLELEELLERTGVEDKVFFEMAHAVVMGYERDITHDLLSYQIGGIIPDYVERFIFLKSR